MRKHLILSVFTCTALGFAACGGDNSADPTTASDTNSESESESESETTPGTTGNESDTTPGTTGNESETTPGTSDAGSESDSATSDSDDTSETTDDSTTGPDIKPGEGLGCDMKNPKSCPEGLKCVGYDDNSDGFPSQTACVESGRGQTGDPCDKYFNDDDNDGILSMTGDSCADGLVCNVFSDSETCVAICGTGGTCDEPGIKCLEGNYLDEANQLKPAIYQCSAETCDPLGGPEACEGMNVCISDGDGVFGCVIGDPEGPGYLEPCMFANVCGAGYACINAEYIPGCGDVGCCSPFCDINEPGFCQMFEDVLICEEWGGMAPDHIGICIAP